jgi:hypothetical protein
MLAKIDAEVVGLPLFWVTHPACAMLAAPRCYGKRIGIIGFLNPLYAQRREKVIERSKDRVSQSALGFEACTGHVPKACAV